MKRFRVMIGLGAVGLGLGGAIVAACGDNAAECGPGTVLVNGVCQVAPGDGSTLDVVAPIDGAGLDSAPPDDGSSDGTATDGGLIDDAAQDAPNRCPFGKGPVMAEIPNLLWDAGTFCMDTTEVSEPQYDQFLKAIGGGKGDAGAQSVKCEFANTDYTPAQPGVLYGKYTYDPPTNGNRPVRGVDWCDAFAYCRWAGKRLCGRYDKVTPPVGDAGGPKRFEHFIACSQNQNQKYCYGNVVQPGACPVVPYGSDAQAPLIPSPQCKGTTPPYSTVYDLGGNVEEWMDTCNTLGCMSGGSNECALMDESIYLGERTVYRGFRCCAD